MKKIELHNLAEYFGKSLPAGKIKDREIRLAIIRLYGALSKADKVTASEIEAIRVKLTEGMEDEVAKYTGLIQKAAAAKGDELKALLDEANAMTECVQIDKDFQESVARLYEEETEVELKKVSLAELYEALADCDFPNFTEDCPIGVVAEAFKLVIND